MSAIPPAHGIREIQAGEVGIRWSSGNHVISLGVQRTLGKSCPIIDPFLGRVKWQAQFLQNVLSPGQSSHGQRHQCNAMSPVLPSTLIRTISSHTGPINALCFSSLGGTYVLSGSSDRQIHLSRTGDTSNSSNLSSKPSDSAVPIQKYAAHGYPILDISCSADNQTFASVGGDRSVFLWDVQAASTTRRFGGTQQGHTSRINAVSFAGAEDSVLVSGSDDRSVRVWDVKSRSANPIMVFEEAGDSVSAVVVREEEIITGSVDGRVRSYDIRMGLYTADIMPAAVTSIQITADGQAILIGCLDSKIRLLDRKNGNCLQAFKGNGFTNEELRIKSCFGKREAIVMSGSEDTGRVNAWDVMTGQLVGSVEAAEKIVSIVRWREKGRGLDGVWASGGADGIIRLWGG
jgi:mitogen-activated protein kinase organizer 1